jgi:hypothetical protein
MVVEKMKSINLHGAMSIYVERRCGCCNGFLERILGGPVPAKNASLPPTLMKEW